MGLAYGSDDFASWATINERTWMLYTTPPPIWASVGLLDHEQKIAKLDPAPNTELKIVKKSGGNNLLVSYDTQLLQEICFRSSTAIRHLGEEAAISLQARHSDIQAATNVFESPVGQIFVDGNLCTLIVPNVLSIVMSPNYAAVEDGDLYDWSTVARVKVMGINDVR